MNRSKDGEDENEAEPGRKVFKTGVLEDGDLVFGVVVVIGSCSSEADAVESAFDIVL